MQTPESTSNRLPTTSSITKTCSVRKIYYPAIPITREGGIVEHRIRGFANAVEDMTWHSDHKEGQVTITIAGPEGWRVSLTIFAGHGLPIIRRVSYDGAFAIPWSELQSLSSDGAELMHLTIQFKITPSALTIHPTGVTYSAHYNFLNPRLDTGSPDCAGYHDIKFSLPGGKSLYTDLPLLKMESPVFRSFFDGLEAPDSVLDASAAEVDSDDNVPPTDPVEDHADRPDMITPGNGWPLREIFLPNVRLL